MNKKWLIVLVLPAIVLAACAPAAPAAPAATAAAVEVTREVEVTRIVEVTPAIEPATATEAPAAAPTEAPSTADTAGFGSTLEAVKARGKLLCGVNGQLPGFSFGEPASIAGFDVDFCRAIAAAIFGDRNAVEFRPYSAEQRFAALEAGDIDVLIRNTTWTLGRDTDDKVNFAAITFYDGQGLMTKNDSGINDAKGIADKTMCVQKGTTTEQNLAEFASANAITFTISTFEDADQTFAAYADGTCAVVSADKSALVTRRGVLADPQNHVILDATLSKEPLAPAVRQGDDQWFDIVNWVVFATFAGEEFNINSQNADSVAEGDTRAEVRRLLGSDPEADLGAKLGLDKAWALNVIKAVGNYAEIYDRAFGPTTVNQIPRGLNNAYRNGGLLYAPAFR
jgi:general L-amino acid transport system substrate-binding protein